MRNYAFISIVAPSILAIYSDLIDEKNNIQYTTSLCEGLINSLLSRFGGLLEEMGVDLTGVTINCNKNDKFYNLYKDLIFLLSPFLDGKFKIRWITQSALGNITVERLCNKIKQLVLNHCLVMTHESENGLSNNPKKTEKHQGIPNASISSSNVDERKNLFANIEHDPKNYKKTKPDDSLTYIREEISRFINDDTITIV